MSIRAMSIRAMSIRAMSIRPMSIRPVSWRSERIRRFNGSRTSIGRAIWSQIDIRVCPPIQAVAPGPVPKQPVLPQTMIFCARFRDYKLAYCAAIWHVALLFWFNISDMMPPRPWRLSNSSPRGSHRAAIISQSGSCAGAFVFGGTPRPRILQ